MMRGGQSSNVSASRQDNYLEDTLPFNGGYLSNQYHKLNLGSLHNKPEASTPSNNIFHRIKVNRARMLEREQDIRKNFTLNDIHGQFSNQMAETMQYSKGGMSSVLTGPT